LSYLPNMVLLNINVFASEVMSCIDIWEKNRQCSHMVFGDVLHSYLRVLIGSVLIWYSVMSCIPIWEYSCSTVHISFLLQQMIHPFRFYVRKHLWWGITSWE
jgi:hypothetical protein